MLGNKNNKNKRYNKLNVKAEKIMFSVFRMNENDFVAAPTKEDAIKWYCEHTGLSENDAIDKKHFAEMDIDTCGMYLPVSEISEDKAFLIEKTAIIEGERNGLLKFRHVLEIQGKTEPYLIKCDPQTRDFSHE